MFHEHSLRENRDSERKGVQTLALSSYINGEKKMDAMRKVHFWSQA